MKTPNPSNSTIGLNNLWNLLDLQIEEVMQIYWLFKVCLLINVLLWNCFANDFTNWV